MASTREEAFLNAYMKKLGRNQHSTVLSAEKQMSGAASFGTNGIKSATMKAEIPKLKALSAEELSKIQKAAIATARAATVRAPASAAPARGKRGTTQGGAKKEVSQSEKTVRSEKSEAETAAIQAKRAGALTDAQKAAEAPKKAQGKPAAQGAKANDTTRTWTPKDRAAATSDALKQQQTLAAGYSKAAHNAAQQNKLSLWEQIKLGAGQLGVKGLSAIDFVNNNVAFNGTAPSAAAAFLRNNTPGYKPVDTAGALEQKISPLAQRAAALTQQEEALAYGKMAQTRESLEQAARAAADFDPNNTAGAKENYTGGSPMTSAWLPFLEALSMAGTSSDTTTPVSAVNGVGQQAVIDGMREIKNDLAPAAEYLTDEQRAVYNYYARGDADKAEKYLETLQYATDAAKVAEQSDIAKRAGDNGAAGAAYTLAMHAGGQASSPLALLDVAGRGLKNKVSGEYMPLNQNSDAMAAQALPDAAMTGMQSDMSPVGRTATDLAVGIADNVANFALLGAAAPAVMAAQSGGRGAYDAAQKGATPGQALASGAAQGAAEYLGESFSFKKLDNVLHGMPAKSAGDWVKSIGGQMANEFSEEAATEVMNILSDIAVMRDKSDAARYADDYIDAHGGSTQAQQDMALALYCAKRVGSAGLAGAITGGVLGGGAQVMNARGYRQQSGAAQGVPEVPYLRNTQPLAEQSRAEVPYVKSPIQGNPLDNASAEQYIKNNRVDALRGSVPVLQNSAENLTGFPVLKGIGHGTVNTENAAERDYGRGIDGGAEPGRAGGSVSGAESGGIPAVSQGLFRQPVNNEKTSAGYLRAGAGVQDFRDTTANAEEFCRALDSARKENKFGLMVGDKTPQKLADSGAITFMSQDGLSGAAVTRDGDIEAVFKNPRSKVAKASYQMVITAVENGGVKLDCYGKGLAQNYAKTGFEPVARIPWDGDSAEAGWTYGEHDVYAMKLRDGVTAEGIADKLGLSESEGGFHMPTDEELAALPTFTDYEKALEYRDSLLPASAAPMEQSSAVIKEVPYLKSAPQKQSDVDAKGVPYLKSAPLKEAKAAPEIPYLKPPKENTVGAKESAYRHDVKTSAVQSNTFANTPMFTQAQKAVAGLDDAGKFQYDAVSEAESMDIAAQRMELDPDGERAELMESRKEWIGEDVDTSMLILEDEMKKAEASGNYGEVLKWAKKIQQSGTKAGQLVQSFAKYSRTPAGTVIGAESWLDKMGKEWADENPKRAELVEEVAKRLCDERKKMGATEFEVVRRMVKEVCAKNKKLKVDESAQDKIAKMLSDASEKDIVDSLDRYFSCGTTGLTDEQVMNIYDLMVRANGENPGSKKAFKLQNEAFKIIADSLGGVSFQQKWDAGRYLSMLGNTRTQGKNIDGNLGFGALTRFNDAMSSAIEAGAQKAGLIKTRTKSVTNMLNEKDRVLRGACYADADDTAYAALTGDSNYNIKSGVEGQRRVFKTNFLEGARKSVNASLDGADAKGMIGVLDFVEGLGDGKNATKAKEFVEKANTLADKAGLNGIYGISGLRNNYADALAGWLKANKHDNSIFDAEQKLAKVKERIAGVVPSLDATYANQLSQRRAELQKQVDALQRGRAYAIQHAQEATFHEYNYAAELLSNFSKGAAEHGIAGKFFSAGVEGLFPFKKTPANILKEGVQYSPAGLLETITIESARLKKGKIDANHYIERLSKGLTGTGLMALGAFLLSQGLISAGGDEDDQKDAFDKMRGKQHYAVTIGETSYTVDWTVPVAMPVFVGAVLYDSFQGDDNKVKGGKLNKFISALSTLGEPLLDTTMLQSFNSAIEDASYADNKLATFAVSALTNHITQIVPTLSGQVARSVDNTRRSTYTGKHGVEGDLSYLVKKTVNKIPFLSKTSEPYIDQWGREQKNLESGGAIARTAYQTLSPGYLQKDKTTAVDKEIDALYAETKENKVIPSIAPSDVQAEGGTRRLSPKEYTAFSKKRGQTAYKLIEELQNSSAYNALDSSEKADAYSDLYGLSSQIGWVETLDDYNAPSETYAKMYGLYKNGGAQDVIDYLTVGALTQGTGKGGAKTNADFYGTVFNGGWGNEAMLKTYIAAAGNTDKANQVFTDKGADMALEYVHMGMDGDFDKNGSVQKDEAVSYLDSSDLTNLQKAYLLRMMNKSWKNPWE